jgi:hypothetical protein
VTALVLLPLAAGLLLAGAAIVWPLAYRVGHHAGVNADRYVGRHRLSWTDEVRLLLARKPAAVEWIPVHAFVRPAAYPAEFADVIELPAVPVGATFGQPMARAAA